MVEWGYSKISEALTQTNIATIKQRIESQAAGEKLAGIAQKTPSVQDINTCVNKGRCFEELIELHDQPNDRGERNRRS